MVAGRQSEGGRSLSFFLDTSVLIRYFTNSPAHLADISAEIIEADDELLVTDVVLAEAAHVLRSFYRAPRDMIVDRLVSLLERDNIDVLHLDKDVVIQALEFCRPSNRVSIPDALIWAAARSQRDAIIYSLDFRFPDTGIEVRRHR